MLKLKIALKQPIDDPNQHIFHLTFHKKHFDFGHSKESKKEKSYLAHSLLSQAQKADERRRIVHGMRHGCEGHELLSLMIPFMAWKLVRNDRNLQIYQ